MDMQPRSDERDRATPRNDDVVQQLDAEQVARMGNLFGELNVFT